MRILNDTAALGQELGREALRLRNTLDFDCHGVERLLHFRQSGLDALESVVSADGGTAPARSEPRCDERDDEGSAAELSHDRNDHRVSIHRISCDNVGPRSKATARAVARRIGKVTRVRHATLVTTADDASFFLLLLFRLRRFLGREMADDLFEGGIERTSRRFLSHGPLLQELRRHYGSLYAEVLFVR
jgi:hypothetical protein